MAAKTRLRLGDGQALDVVACPAAERPLLLFPSIGEYLAYDDQACDGFMAAGERNTAYRQALGAASPGRVVLDIGTGRDALWAITAARAGARQVYAVEAQATVAAQAERAVRRAGLASLVQVITGRSQDIELPGLGRGLRRRDHRQYRVRGRGPGHPRRRTAPGCAPRAASWCPAAPRP